VSDLDPSIAAGYERAQFPSPETPWREATFSAIDFETTGLDSGSDEIISFATVTVDQGRVSLADARYRLVRPRHMPGGETIRIHGLRESDLAKAPPLSEVLVELLEAITGRVLIAHVAAVETSFLAVGLAERGLRLRNPVVDTAALAAELQRRRRRSLGGQQPIGLSGLARSLQLPVHRPHHAEGDALTTAQVFLALATHLDGFEPQTVGSLAQTEYRPGLRWRIGERLRRLRDQRIRSSARP
jgi:DNA polymerase-3 subunit epsilon